MISYRGVAQLNTFMEEQSMESLKKKLADTIARWLLRDIRLNANAASSTHYYEPDIPKELKNYKMQND